ncbi:OmpP1/FadL family transporter [Legionella donaldsonii]|nr:outer membrane protein transport protein [Legionella donaldsonii]
MHFNVKECGVKSMQKPMRTIVSAAVVAMMASTIANAGSFSLYTESTASAVGNYAAGVAAEAADASTGWYNPAGLALIRQQQVVVGAVGVFPSSELTGTSTFRTVGLPPFGQTFSGIQGAKDAVVPSFHYALPLGENATFGLSIVSPFGLVTDWDKTSQVRYGATISELITTNVSPEIGGKLTENLALGGGIDFQYARVKFNRILGEPALMQAFGFPPSFVDSMSYNKGDSFGIGFHAGVLTMFNDNHTRIGLNYQSQMKHKFNGYSRLGGRYASPGFNVINPVSVATATPNNTIWNNNLSSNDIDLPEIVTLSAYQDVNEKLALLGSVVYTGWHSLRTIQLNNALTSAPVVGVVKVISASIEDYDNAWRFALGANYHVNEQLMLRVGGGYDQTPTTNLHRSIRIPDSDRWALSIGAHYQLKPEIGVDVGYTHLFATGDRRINRTDPVSSFSTYNINADIDAHADLVGIQAVWTIDKPVPVATK